MLKRRAPGEELILTDQSVDILVGDERRTLNPVAALQNLLTRRKEARQETIEGLAQSVAQKLLTGIVDKGIVSVFHNRETGELETEMYSAEFSSERLPHLGVMVIRRRTKTDSLNSTLLGVSIIEHWVPNKTHQRRSLKISRTCDMPEGGFSLEFSDENGDEGRPMIRNKSRTNVISDKDKIEFLQDILATDIDEGLITDHFGAPYTPGGTRSSNRPGDHSIHNAYWVRDICSDLPALTMATPELPVSN